MEKLLLRLEKEYGDLYKEIFTELSKLQIEEKYLERQAQSLVEDIRKEHNSELDYKLNMILEYNDPDFALQFEHTEHLKEIGEIPQSIKIDNILSEHFGSNEAEMYAFR